MQKKSLFEAFKKGKTQINYLKISMKIKKRKFFKASKVEFEKKRVALLSDPHD